MEKWKNKKLKKFCLQGEQLKTFPPGILRLYAMETNLINLMVIQYFLSKN